MFVSCYYATINYKTGFHLILKREREKAWSKWFLNKSFSDKRNSKEKYMHLHVFFEIVYMNIWIFIYVWAFLTCTDNIPITDCETMPSYKKKMKIKQKAKQRKMKTKAPMIGKCKLSKHNTHRTFLYRLYIHSWKIYVGT